MKKRWQNKGEKRSELHRKEGDKRKDSDVDRKNKKILLNLSIILFVGRSMEYFSAADSDQTLAFSAVRSAEVFLLSTFEIYK